jgi:hypothetical protein
LRINNALFSNEFRCKSKKHQKHRIRRERTGDDPHPVKLSDDNDDFWVAQARRANVLLDAPEFSAVVVATNGTMARMHTVAPTTFVTFKRWLAGQRDRDALKRRRDELQADAVQRLVDEYLVVEGR